MIKTKTLALLLLLAACTPVPVDLKKQAETEILSADRTMSEKATREGFFKTLLLYADDGVVKFDEGQFPIVGKNALQKAWKENPGPTTISWEPFKAEAARSGELGYTLGYWKFAGTDTTLYGNYFTLWKKQADGQWKFVADGGNSMPGPPPGK